MKYFKKTKIQKLSKSQLPVRQPNNAHQRMETESEMNAGEITDNKTPIEDMIVLSKIFNGEWH